MSDLPRPDRFLPLAPVWFEILLALAGGDLHGYAVMQEVARRSGGAVTLHPGSLYRALARLLEDALIVELEARPSPGTMNGGATTRSPRSAARSPAPKPTPACAAPRRRGRRALRPTPSPKRGQA